MWGGLHGLDPTALRAGIDVVLHASPGQAEQLAPGVLLDDWTPTATRSELDGEARAQMAAWQASRETALTANGVPLHRIHELDLYADVFMRELRVVNGLSVIGERGRGTTMSLTGVDAALADCLEAVLARTGIEVRRGAAGHGPNYPLTFRRRMSGRQRVTGALRIALGLPGRPRGTVLVEPYWSLAGVWGLLAARAATRPVVSPFNPPELGRRELLRSIRLGGWLGTPGARLRARSRRRVSAAVAELATSPAADPLERLFDLRAADLLGVVARDTVAETDLRRRAFASGRLRATLAYSDTAPGPRINAVVAREHAAPVLQAQHGLYAHLPRDDGSRPARILDGWSADVVAVWSDRTAAAFAPHVPGRVEVTGNPGAMRLLAGDTRGGGPASGRALVLAQPTGPLSTITDARVPGRHLHAALSALEASGAARQVTVRPHPLDVGWDAYARIGGAYPALEVSVDASGPVEAVIRAACVCVGAASTATLQAAALGVPSVLLDFTGMPLEWPFDGAGDFPVARSQDELTALLSDLGAIDPQTSREVALEALGARPGAASAIADLVADAVRR